MTPEDEPTCRDSSAAHRSQAGVAHRGIVAFLITSVVLGLAAALLAVLALTPVAPSSLAQPGEGPAPVGWTEARSHAVRRSATLTGTVDARRTSVVASEVPGLVVSLDAREGDLVGRGSSLARLRRQNLELQLKSRQAELQEAEARLDLARRTLERNRELFDSEVISRQRLDDATSELAAWQGRVDNLKAQIEQVEDDLERSRVRAPFTGVVVAEHTQVGEWLAVGSPVVELLDVEELEVELDVPERFFADLGTGAGARVSFEALPDVIVDGRIAAIIPRADRQTRTFPVKVRFPNRDHAVAVGMLARVSFPVGEAYQATVVPKDALVRRGNRELVYRVTDGTVEEVTVTSGTAEGVWIEITGPVKPGDRVVTRGNERLRPGQAVSGEAVPYDEPAAGS